MFTNPTQSMRYWMIDKKVDIAIVLMNMKISLILAVRRHFRRTFKRTLTDQIDYFEKKIAENHYAFSARLEIDYLNSNYRFNLQK